MAVMDEGGAGASVRYINPSDNRGAGASIGRALNGAGVEPGDTIRIIVE
jgi:hypothetical protein